MTDYRAYYAPCRNVRIVLSIDSQAHICKKNKIRP